MTRTREENAADLAFEESWKASLVPVYVVVTGDASEPDDESVPGIYLCHVDPSLTSEERSEVALDHFHENIGIGCLDDFVIIAVTADGEELPRMGNYEPGSKRSYGEFGDHLNDDDIPAAVKAKMASDAAAPGV